MGLLSSYHAADGVRVFVRSLGQGEPVVLVHGYLVSQRSFDAVLEPLSRRFQVFALDLPGHGESDRPSSYPYSIDAFADTVLRVLDSIGLSRVSLVGHSMGGAVALNVAANYPESVERVVAIDAAVFPFKLPVLGRVALLPVVGELLFKKLYSKRDLRAYLRDEVYLDRRLPTVEDLEFYWERFNRPGGRDAAYRGLQTMASLEVLDGLPARVACPTLVVWGEGDRILQRGHGSRLAESLPRGRLVVIHGSGHAPQEEQPAEFLDAVVPFLDGKEG
jgi:pimeloyl-ACP methyl ester carboxylesterase